MVFIFILLNMLLFLFKFSADKGCLQKVICQAHVQILCLCCQRSILDLWFAHGHSDFHVLKFRGSSCWLSVCPLLVVTIGLLVLSSRLREFSVRLKSIAGFPANEFPSYSALFGFLGNVASPGICWRLSSPSPTPSPPSLSNFPPSAAALELTKGIDMFS